MLRTATTLPRSRQNPDYLEIGVVAVVSVATLSLIASGYGQYGALLIAVSASLFVLVKTGTFRTKYQKEIAGVLQPIDRANVRQIEASSDLDTELEHLRAIKPPAEACVIHNDVIEAMRLLINVQRGLTISLNIVGYWGSALKGLESLSVDAANDTLKPKDMCLASYVAEASQVVTVFRVKQDGIAARHYERTARAIEKLRNIAPAKRRALAHRELIGGLVRLNDLSMEQHRGIYNGDVASTARATEELGETREVILGAIRHVLRWH